MYIFQLNKSFKILSKCIFFFYKRKSIYLIFVFSKCKRIKKKLNEIAKAAETAFIYSKKFPLDRDLNSFIEQKSKYKTKI